MWAHGIFDFDFAADHFFAAIAASTFFAVLGIGALFFTVMRSVYAQDKSAGQHKLALLASKAWKIFVTGYLICLLVFLPLIALMMAMSGIYDLSGITVGLMVVGSILALRWYISDSVVSNYATAFVALIGLIVLSVFYVQAARLYQDIALRPLGLSGLWVEVERDSKITERCLVLLAPKTAWFTTDKEITFWSREHLSIRMPLAGNRSKSACSTMPP